jgi:hypothetical protein
MRRINGFHFPRLCAAGIVPAAFRVDSPAIAAYWEEGRSTMPGRMHA